MLIIEIKPLENGAHRNQRGDIINVPAGWIEVPSEMEEVAASYLPFINLDIDGGILVGVSQGETLPPDPEEKEQAYKMLVQQYVHEKYTFDDESALTNKAIELLSNGQELSKEYLEYRAFVEECKERAKKELNL